MAGEGGSADTLPKVPLTEGKMRAPARRFPMSSIRQSSTSSGRASSTPKSVPKGASPTSGRLQIRPAKPGGGGERIRHRERHPLRDELGQPVPFGVLPGDAVPGGGRRHQGAPVARRTTEAEHGGRIDRARFVRLGDDPTRWVVHQRGGPGVVDDGQIVLAGGEPETGEGGARRGGDGDRSAGLRPGSVEGRDHHLTRTGPVVDPGEPGVHPLPRRDHRHRRRGRDAAWKGHDRARRRGGRRSIGGERNDGQAAVAAGGVSPEVTDEDRVSGRLDAGHGEVGAGDAAAAARIGQLRR